MTAAVKNDTVEIIRACASAWNVIQEHHPDVPDVVVTLAAGQDGKKLKLGHFHPNSWMKGDDTLDELFIGGEGLRRGAVELLGTLLHEAAHGIAARRGIKDTSRQGRFHNAKFKAIGEELGLILTQNPQVGWSATAVPGTTQLRYAEQIKQLDAVLGVYRREYAATEPSKGTSGTRVYPTCECDRKFQISKSVLEQGPIYCGLCDCPFTEED